MPPDSDTAKAKQAKAQAGDKDKKAGAGKGRIPSIPKQELAAIAVTLAARVQTVVPSLKYKHYRAIQSLAADWYKALYHTAYHLTKSAYLQCLYDNAVGLQHAKEADKNHLELFIKALDVLKQSVNDPTTVGLSDPATATADTAATQRQTTLQKGKAVADSYVSAVTGKSKAPPFPIGAKNPAVKASAKAASGAIGAPTIGKPKDKPLADNPPIGAPLAAKQDSDKQQDTSLTSDSAMDYLIKAASDQSFADFQRSQAAQGARDANAAEDSQTAQDAVTAQNVPAQPDARAVSDTQAAQDPQTVQGVTQPSTQVTPSETLLKPFRGRGVL